MARWVKDQMTTAIVPMTSLRETYRKGSDFSLVGEAVGGAAVTPKHPCAENARFRDYAFSSDDMGKYFEVVDFQGKYLIVLDGMPRSIVDTFMSNDGRSGVGLTWSGPGTYELRYRIGGAVGGSVFIMDVRFFLGDFLFLIDVFFFYFPHC